MDDGSRHDPARDVVGHLVTWFPGLLETGAGVRLPPCPPVETEPVRAWLCHSDAVQRLLEDPATVSRSFTDPHLGVLPLAEAVDYEQMLPLDDVLRASGQFGPRVEVPEDADAQTRLLGLVGRRA